MLTVSFTSDCFFPSFVHSLSISSNKLGGGPKMMRQVL